MKASQLIERVLQGKNPSSVVEDSEAGGEFKGKWGDAGYYTKSLDGPWQVGAKGLMWYIHNTETGDSKRIGPVQGKGKNYRDAATQEAEKRNAALKKGAEAK